MNVFLYQWIRYRILFHSFSYFPVFQKSPKIIFRFIRIYRKKNKQYFTIYCRFGVEENKNFKI
jgi:hypothetical protein